MLLMLLLKNMVMISWQFLVKKKKIILKLCTVSTISCFCLLSTSRVTAANQLLRPTLSAASVLLLLPSHSVETIVHKFKERNNKKDTRTKHKHLPSNIFLLLASRKSKLLRLFLYNSMTPGLNALVHTNIYCLCCNVIGTEHISSVV